MKNSPHYIGNLLLVLAGCAGQKQAERNFIQENIDNAVAQRQFRQTLSKIR